MDVEINEAILGLLACGKAEVHDLHDHCDIKPQASLTTTPFDSQSYNNDVLMMDAASIPTRVFSEFSNDVSNAMNDKDAATRSRDLIGAVQAYLSVGMNDYKAQFDNSLQKIVQDGVESILGSSGGDEALGFLEALVASGTRAQQEIFADAETFVLEYAFFLDKYNLAFGCLEESLPEWASSERNQRKRKRVDQNISTLDDKDEILMDTMISSANNSDVKESDAERKQLPGTIARRKKFSLAAEKHCVLMNWLQDHMDDPYPPKTDKDELIAATGMTKTQVDNWFINARRRYLPKIREERDKMK